MELVQPCVVFELLVKGVQLKLFACGFFQTQLLSRVKQTDCHALLAKLFNPLVVELGFPPLLLHLPEFEHFMGCLLHLKLMQVVTDLHVFLCGYSQATLVVLS